MSKAKFLEKTDFFQKDWDFDSFKLLSDGFWILAEYFRRKNFDRKLLAGFSRLQLVFLRKRFHILFQFFFIFFAFWVTFLSTSGGKYTGGLLKLHFLALRNFLRWLASKIINMFQKFWIPIEIFHLFEERFPAALCKLHSNYPEEHLEGFFISENTKKNLSISNFWSKSLRPLTESFLASSPK